MWLSLIHDDIVGDFVKKCVHERAAAVAELPINHEHLVAYAAGAHHPKQHCASLIIQLPRRPYIDRAGTIIGLSIPFRHLQYAISIEQQGSRIESLGCEAGVQREIVKEVPQLVAYSATDLPMERKVCYGIIERPDRARLDHRLAQIIHVVLRATLTLTGLELPFTGPSQFVDAYVRDVPIM